MSDSDINNDNDSNNNAAPPAGSPAGATPPTAAVPPALPDRLSVDPRSPHHHAAVFEHEVGIRLNGKERVDVNEYCISEGWVKVPSGKTVDRKGNPLLLKLTGKVEAFYRESTGTNT